MTEPKNRFYAPALIELPPSEPSDGDLKQIAEQAGCQLTPELAQELREALRKSRPPVLYSHEDLEQIAERMEKMDWELTPKLAQELREAARDFLAQRAMADNALRPSDEKYYIEKLQKAYGAIGDVYKELGGAETSELSLCWPPPSDEEADLGNLAERRLYQIADRLPKDVTERSNYERFIQAGKDAFFFDGALKKALENMPKDTGRPKNWPLDGFICQLHHICTRETGKEHKVAFDSYTGQGTGPFYDFVNACLSPIAPEEIRQSLYQTIKRALGK